MKSQRPSLVPNRMSNAGRGVNKKGRSKKYARFIMIPHFVFDSLAYRSMKPGPRSLLDVVIRKFNGVNNGQIGLSLRHAAEQLNVSKNTVHNWRNELEEKGFISQTRGSGFNMKDATRRAPEWRITWLAALGKPATREFLNYPNLD